MEISGNSSLNYPGFDGLRLWKIKSNSLTRVRSLNFKKLKMAVGLPKKFPTPTFTFALNILEFPRLSFLIMD